jgi:hypothetical protein
MIGLMVALHKDRMRRAQLAVAVGEMRMDVRDVYVDIMMNGRATETVLEFIREKGAVSLILPYYIIPGASDRLIQVGTSRNPPFAAPVPGKPRKPTLTSSSPTSSPQHAESLAPIPDGWYTLQTTSTQRTSQTPAFVVPAPYFPATTSSSAPLHPQHDESFSPVPGVRYALQTTCMAKRTPWMTSLAVPIPSDSRTTRFFQSSPLSPRKCQTFSSHSGCSVHFGNHPNDQTNT